MTSLAVTLEIDGAGAHPAAWRRAAHPPSRHFDPGRLRALGETVERSGFTAVTLEDDLLPGPAPAPAGRIGSLERAAFLAEVTSVLGLVPVVSTTYTEPFHVSSALAALDHIGYGRAGWVVGSTENPAAALAWSRPAVTGEAALRREAADSLRVVRALWDSWEDDAVVRDVATSRYLDRDRLHYIDFEGETYSVKGPAIVPRPPQGNPVVFAAPELVDPADADVALISGRDVRAVAAASSRASAAPRRFAEVEVALDTEAHSGAERVADLARHAPWADRGRLRYVGDAQGFVRLLADLARTVDGVRLHPLVLDEDLPTLASSVLPRLRAERLTVAPVPGQWLRSTLGLAAPANPFATTEG
ncbi:LLM class flavin-dependent oxidoreductase [Amycolatopsis sp. NPDC005232]|uniref:LLM class flavin-dependent oxidoreductase n=1 Tax=Amycolatopsis sp. NPDC005232 TaxID=3157027 RepID=UPI0033B73E18